ncbi:PAS domain S-box-containing protein [Tistlia consotensis]|uniref:PAS domain S-box-containing protein n=1 Tax=Tistlia consotensis USBA 355 TaxID=560819 RepID=A0A1Y6CLR4_9PROT|nr:HD domain-containing phosphohydrolase [Tistlia consotensis]SMF63095.1 PAS domain S-box-containing protein [Tistlia consotensis USBA 355]SNR95533.1 PAS domain S-box-containing protein [Tistlia consotensis]
MGTVAPTPAPEPAEPTRIAEAVPPEAEEVVEASGGDWRPWAVGALLVLAAVAGVLWVFRFVDGERQQELRVWQDRLALVAESRAAATDEWLQGQRSEIAALADNTSLRLLLSELALAGGDLHKVTDADGQVGYADNLLEATAERSGYVDPDARPRVGANLPYEAHAGIAVLDGKGRPVIATSAFDSGDVARAGAPGEVALSLAVDPKSGPLLQLAAPVYALQSDPAPGQEVGWVIAQRPADAPLRRLLTQPGLPPAGIEIWLLRREGAAVDYLVEAGGGAGGLLAADTPDLAGAAALAQPGGFGIHGDRDGKPVLALSRRLAQAPLTLMVTADKAAALAESEARLGRLMVLLLLAIGLIGAGMAVIWRHGASRRARFAARAYRQAARALAEQRDLLRLVTDNQPTAITILDSEGRYRFANRTAGTRAGMASADMLGKEMSAVRGAAAARRTLALAEQARGSGEPVSDTLRIEPAGPGGDETDRQVFATDHIPVPRNATLGDAVLVVERDLTTEFRERARRERALGDLVEALVRLVDKRDPFAADHSQRVGRLAQSLAREMGLSERERETARVAGLLMNVGKIAVPETLLTRKGELSDEERRLVRDSMSASADLLQGIELDGPVVETLRQAQDAGRPGAGQPPLAPARILAVANAFVGMVSDRAWRSRLSVDEAIAEIMAGIGTRYDRGVVAALIGYLDNKGGRADWDAAASRPSTEA